jgi:hypothetical protein
MEVSDLIHDRLSLGFERRISDRWSASVSASIDYKVLNRNVSREEAEHRNEFDIGNVQNITDFGSHMETISFTYWPEGLFNGPHISIGGIYCQRLGIDAAIGLGYILNIIKGVSVSIRYDTGLRLAGSRGLLHADCLKAGINYSF